MLSTLINLGTQLSENRGEWDDIIDYPHVDKDLKNGVSLFVAPIIFDLDRKDVYFGHLKEYDGVNSCLQYKYIKTLTGSGKATYACVEAGKLEQLRKTFFGKVNTKGNPPESGQFQEAIQKDFPSFKNTPLGRLLPEIFSLRRIFEKKMCLVTEVKGKRESLIDEKKVMSNIKGLTSNSRIVLYYTSVVSKKNSFRKPIPICEVEGFEAFMRARFLEKEKKTGVKLSYASGLQKENVIGVDFPNRYSLNHMFVETTLNYATNFDKRSYYKNYQLSAEEQLLMERGSRYILEHLKIRIAGVDHCILPQFLHFSRVDIPYITKGLFRENELLFAHVSIDRLTARIRKETGHPFWLTYLAFDTNGNFFKTIHQIKDVSKIQFYKVIDAFQSVNDFFDKELDSAVNWLSVLTEYGQQYVFNLSTIYSIIPVRKEKETKNEALSLFKCIFENRKITPGRLFKSFSELVLCHRFQRYRSFTNIKGYKKEAFDFAVRDAVFKYLALIHVLRRLKLITIMEENEQTSQQNERIGNGNEKKIYAFLDRLSYDESQRALFFLGRMLSSVAFIQEGKKRNILDKVNFNGMKLPDILRLRNNLIEKARQYNAVSKVIFNDAEFTKYFRYEGWKMSPQEAVFFILSGYSFGINLAKETNKQNPIN